MLVDLLTLLTVRQVSCLHYQYITSNAIPKVYSLDQLNMT